MFRIIDGQCGGYFHDGQKFTKKTAIENLASYHSIDWSDERYPNIEDWLKSMKDDNERLNQLLEWGTWEIEE